MAYSVDQAWVNQYVNSVDLLSQQKNSILENSVEQGDAIGEYKFFERIEPFSFTKKTASNQATTFTDVTHNKRAVAFDDYTVNLYVDKRDLKRALIDPQSAYVEGGVAGWNVEKDQIIMDAIFGTAKEGKATGVAFTDKVFDTANQTVDLAFLAGDPIGAGNGTGTGAGIINSGLTLPKILKARQILLSNKALVAGDQIFCAIDPIDEIDLMGIEQFIRNNYVGDKPYEMGIDPEGYIGYWLGIHWLRSNHVPTVDAAVDYRRCPMYVKSGIGMVKGGVPEVDVMKNPERDGAWTIHMEGSGGAVRKEEKKVVEIRTGA